MLRAFVKHHHGNWSQHIPAKLYAYHNTIHGATGYTPHMLLFGWSPRDLRAPLLSAEAAGKSASSGDRDSDVWLQTRARSLRRAQNSLECAGEAMIRAG
jgi:hypothetical protein